MLKSCLLGALALLALQTAAHGQLVAIKGKIVLADPIEPAATPARAMAPKDCGGPVVAEDLLVSKKLELQNALLFLANLQPETLPPATVPLTIANCSFQPRVLAVMQGDTLVIRNQDAAVRHARGELWEFRPGWQGTVTRDIFAKVPGPAFNLVFPAKHSAAVEALQTPGLIEIGDEIGHAWMRASVLVMPHRGFAVSNPKGEFSLPPVPPGKYDLILWHERLGVKRQLVEASLGKTEPLLITWDFPMPSGAAAVPDAEPDSARLTPP